MRRAFLIAGLVAVAWLVLGEVAFRTDFMAALGGLRRGRPLLVLVEVLFFGLRAILLVAGPPLLAVTGARAAWSRLTKS